MLNKLRLINEDNLYGRQTILKSVVGCWPDDKFRSSLFNNISDISNFYKMQG